MSIKILPARLANQIAAGEVVERPASVVKELLENSLDSGATRIEVDIVKGGHKRVLIRDNGAGIEKDELGLALSRHATSKIHTLEDLENIVSLGFRGEALASISSVSRLTLTSKPAAQEEAWQAQCEGRDMEVAITPAAHPNGTSVDVQDLFFNTPARRKFLRTEKTEFTHIDELFKRAVLSHFDVHFVLRHNDKIVRQFAAAKNEAAKLKRVAQICGKAFQDTAIEFASEYQAIQFHGWLAGVGGERAQNDQQYVYINGRMMKDKLIAHAIRQAYEGLIPSDSYPAYVVYLQMPASMLDVNVHPTKQEVRFHQARLVHDFIYKTVNDALQQQMQRGFEQEQAFNSEPVWGSSTSQKSQEPQDSHELQAPQVHQLNPVQYTQLSSNEPSHQYIKPLTHDVSQAPNNTSDRITHGVSEHSPSSAYSSGAMGTGRPPFGERRNMVGSRNIGSAQQRTASNNYQNLMSTAAPSFSAEAAGVSVSHHAVSDKLAECVFVEPSHLLLKKQASFYLISLVALERKELITSWRQQVPVSQPLLMPISLPMDKSIKENLDEKRRALSELSIELIPVDKRLVLRKVPAGYRQVNWAMYLPELLQHEQLQTNPILAFATVMIAESKVYDDVLAMSLWQRFALILGKEDNSLNGLLMEVPVADWVAQHLNLTKEPSVQ
ncbi:DNA mismatch repair endonuclease MutL [Paraneptunicella aestuarii]|uniref:DNA mismatch repair endonuclease MutL n=1 Tax=Paraneptunicella aestuarii TaxID=2831148 RepID=UPI001E65CBF3|nr:DNA mismatch repair endonuclease MutL [Paraneptunicella aestuarii]UAA38965.1 DNA mismatch repair endonuclease MutL [Paraneptunicella aestuarii]